jgi:hypothetical protein
LAALFAVHNDKNSMSLHEHERGKSSVTVDVGDLHLAHFFGGIVCGAQQQ